MKMRRLLLAFLIAGPALAGPRIVPASDLLINVDTPTLSWRWRAAPEAATQPDLLAAMRSTAFADAAKAKADAAADAADAAKEGFPVRGHQSISDWSLAADTTKLLVLAGEVYSYTGGAHGNTTYATQIWDKAAARAIGFDALFTDWPRARALLEPAFCKALAAEQRRRLGNQPANDMHACPKLAEQPIVPWAGLARQAGQFRVLLAPYVAGSYAEGPYLITVPWPEGIGPLVRPAYRADLFDAAP